MPKDSSSSHFRAILGLVALATAFLAPPSPARAQNEKGAGITIAGDADAKDIGLPLYPGSRRHKDKDSDSPGLDFGLWGSGSGFKLAVLKLESDDSMDKIADYYKKHLSKYGKVLDCSHPSPSDSASKEFKDKDDKSNILTCGDDKPDSGGLLFKSGTKSDQHLVAIHPNPNGHGTLFDLVHLAHWDK
jgi:hypothetical protein